MIHQSIGLNCHKFVKTKGRQFYFAKKKEYFLHRCNVHHVNVHLLKCTLLNTRAEKHSTDSNATPNFAKSLEKTKCLLKKTHYFQKSKMEVRQIIFLMYCYIDNKSYESVIREVNFFTNEHILSRNTISHYYSLFREICTLAVETQSAKNKIGGEGFTVEIDESKFGRRKYNKGRIVTGTWVLGGICVESGELFLQPVEKRDKETLLPIIIDRVHPGTTIITDCWRAYNDLAYNEFNHLTVNHSLHFVG